MKFWIHSLRRFFDFGVVDVERTFDGLTLPFVYGVGVFKDRFFRAGRVNKHPQNRDFVASRDGVVLA